MKKTKKVTVEEKKAPGSIPTPQDFLPRPICLEVNFIDTTQMKWNETLQAIVFHYVNIGLKEAVKIYKLTNPKQ